MIQKAGLAPGIAIYTGDVEARYPDITLIRYSITDVTTYECDSYECEEDFFNKLDSDTHMWLHVEPISDQEAVAKFCDRFAIHPLVIEDILAVAHRPKIEEFDEYIFAILKHVEYAEEELTFSQISLILKENLLISFADRSPERFEAIKKRLEKKDSRIRREGGGYLFFALIDYLVDEYFVVLEAIGERIEDLEDEILYSPSKKSIEKVHDLKRVLLELKKSVWPIRELLNTILQSQMIEEKHHIYFRDTYDHIVNIIDIIEGYKDSVAGFLDIYLSTLSNRMNEIMKTLSIISTIFIPLSFLTGYFGMNFKFETILESKSAYDFSNLAMLGIPILLLVYFKLRKWF